jgi:hypothetical protein
MVVTVPILGRTWNRPSNRRHGEGSPQPQLVERRIGCAQLQAIHRQPIGLVA